MSPKIFGLNLTELSQLSYVKTTYVTFPGIKLVTFVVGVFELLGAAEEETHGKGFRIAGKV